MTNEQSLWLLPQQWSVKTATTFNMMMIEKGFIKKLLNIDKMPIDHCFEHASPILLYNNIYFMIQAQGQERFFPIFDWENPRLFV